MIAQRDGIVAERIQDRHLDGAAQLGEIGGSLDEVAGMQQKHVFGPVGRADGVDVGGAFQGTAHAGILAGADGFHVGVGVVHVQDGEFMHRLLPGFDPEADTPSEHRGAKHQQRYAYNLVFQFHSA